VLWVKLRVSFICPYDHSLIISEFCFYALNGPGFGVCALCVCEGLLFFCKVLMCSAVSFLYTSHSEGGRCDMAA